MQNNKLLIVGDSFSANHGPLSWTAQLQNFAVTNLSSNGSSEYRILKKLLSCRVQQYSHVVVVHTSPYRIYVDKNPIHHGRSGYQDCDLIYQDVKNCASHPFAENIAWFFENVFDLEQANLVHQLMIEKIIDVCDHAKSLHLTFFETACQPELVNLNDIWVNHPGDINHLDTLGNQKVAQVITNLLE